jgi:hypothetical protein
MGGLSKKIFQINSLRTKNAGNFLLLDSGNLLFKRRSIGHGLNQERLTAKAILQVYKESGYDAVGVGPLDLAGGLDFLLESQAGGFPWVSANISDDSGSPLFQPWIQRSFGGKDIAITSVMATPVVQIPGTTVQPWKESLGALIPAIKKQNSKLLIIVLSTLSTKENTSMAQLFPQIRIVLGADTKLGNISPRSVGQSLLFQTARQGKYQGVLSIDFGMEDSWGQGSKKEMAALQNKLGSLKWQLKRIEKRKPHSPNSAKLQETVQRLKSEEKQLLAQINDLKQLIGEETTKGPKNSRYTNRFIGLDTGLPDDSATEAQLKELARAVRTLHKEAKAKAKKRGSARTSQASDQNITGYAVCAACHTEQTAFWHDTRHAEAYTTLVKKKKNLDLDCLPCHVTLDFRTVQLASLTRQPLLSYPLELVSVGCETCHGAGKKHSINPEKFSMVSRPSKKICLNCHTPERDDNFNYADKVMTISCPTL